MEFSKEEVLCEMHRTGIVPVFYHADIEIAKAALECSYNNGIRVIEFVSRGENTLTVFSELVKFVAKFPGLILGIGTVMNASSAENFIRAGAKFIVSPILKIALAPVCQANNKLWVPGTATLTEIVNARDAGAELIKIFPGSVLGPKFVSAILPVVPGLKLMPTGGVEVTEGNLKAWFDAGVFCVGMGSQLFSDKIMGEKNWSELESKIKKALAIVSQIRTAKSPS
jgi:2-dehydro-3-deoxyphosphogluconate aldolase/(4S)-4-hydroxy-2-oxoglutarate aldolase